ncbi:MAG: hypothetical protein IJX57_01270, partial [Clostridia bacterium]|nr:hypothetical protein [Clostridia bacterium]
MKKNKILSAVLATVMLASSATAFAAEVGENLTVSNYAKSAEETQKMIEARPDMRRPMEKLSRGA